LVNKTPLIFGPFEGAIGGWGKGKEKKGEGRGGGGGGGNWNPREAEIIWNG